jgi:hypothetical protein
MNGTMYNIWNIFCIFIIAIVIISWPAKTPSPAVLLCRHLSVADVLCLYFQADY